jgi:hypothetical protein
MPHGTSARSNFSALASAQPARSNASFENGPSRRTRPSERAESSNACASKSSVPRIRFDLSTMASVSASPPFSVPARSSCRTASFFSPSSRSAIPRLYCEKPADRQAVLQYKRRPPAGGRQNRYAQEPTSSRISSGISPDRSSVLGASSGWPSGSGSGPGGGGLVAHGVADVCPQHRLICGRRGGATVTEAQSRLGVLDGTGASRAWLIDPVVLRDLRVERWERLEPLLW